MTTPSRAVANPGPAEAVNAAFLRRGMQDVLAHPHAAPPSTFDVAFSALVDLVEMRARKLYPEKFTTSLTPPEPDLSEE